MSLLVVLGAGGEGKGGEGEGGEGEGGEGEGAVGEGGEKLSAVKFREESPFPSRKVSGEPSASGGDIERRILLLFFARMAARWLARAAVRRAFAHFMGRGLALSTLALRAAGMSGISDTGTVSVGGGAAGGEKELLPSPLSLPRRMLAWQ